MQSHEPPGPAGEAARYAVLRRLGPALRHDLVVNLQSVTMMAEVLAARLDQGSVSTAQMHEQVRRMQRAASDAVAGSLAVAAWLAPPEDDGIDLRQGIEAALGLVHTGLGFRGFTLHAAAPPAGFAVCDSLLRLLLLASLLRLSDQAPGPGELVVQAVTQGDEAQVNVQRQPAPGPAQAMPAGEEPPSAYRRIEAADLQALAATTPAHLVEQDERITLRLQRWVARTPLAIAPH